ncbi:MAG TPA: hypothetical protein VOA87_11730 [Thermoanaerobaculia bacterium]|nr:hypothetical protein [Thermoanaerobaculia bacterium]
MPNSAALAARLTLLPALVVLLAAASPATAPPKPAVAAPHPAMPATQLALKDRIVAVVDEDPILNSDIDRVLGLGLAQAKPGEGETDLRRRVLGTLIDQRLRFHEIDRFGFQQVPVDQIEQNVAEIRSRFKDEAAFNQRLKELGMTLASLKQLVGRQLMVLTYVDERLGPRVFVSLEDINAYYRDVLVPEMKKQRQPVPPIEEVREKIRGLLKDQRLNQEIDRWTEELRNKADVANYFDQRGNALPPIVKTIVKKPPKPS